MNDEKIVRLLAEHYQKGREEERKRILELIDEFIEEYGAIVPLEKLKQEIEWVHKEELKQRITEGERNG